MKGAGAKGFYREDGAVWDLAKAAYVPRKKDPRVQTLATLRKFPWHVDVDKEAAERA